MFDLTVNLGHIINITAMLCGGFYFLWKMQAQIAMINVTQINLSSRLAKIDEDLVQLSKVVVEVARQDERMNAIDVRLTALGIRLDERFILTPSSLRRRKG